MPNRRYVHKILILEYSKIIFVCVMITDYKFFNLQFYTVPFSPLPTCLLRNGLEPVFLFVIIGSCIINEKAGLFKGRPVTSEEARLHNSGRKIYI